MKPKIIETIAMKKMKKIGLATAFFSVASIFATSTYAENDDNLYIDGYIGVVNEMRDRGVAYDMDFPALTGNLTLSSDMGLYGGVKAAALKGGFIHDLQLEAFAGYSFDSASGYNYDFSVALDHYKGTKRLNLGNIYDGTYSYPEIKLDVSRDFGLVYFSTGVAYAPDGRWSNPNAKSLYVSTDIEVPVPTIPELTVLAHVGYDHLAAKSGVFDGVKDRFDWSLGLSAFVSDIELSLTYERAYDADPIAPTIGTDRNGSLIFGARMFF